jgi:ATP-binding cassette subfamily B protein
MVSIHPMLTLACLAPTPALWLTTKWFSQKVRPAFLENRTLFDDLILRLSENLRGVHVVKGFAREQEEIARFRERNAHVSDHRDSIYRVMSVFQPLVGQLTMLSLFIMLAYGGYLVIQFEQAVDVEAASRVGLSIGQLLVFAGLLQQFSAQVGNTANLVHVAQHSLTAAERVLEVLDKPLEIASPPEPVHLGRVRGEVVFEDVCFGYHDDEHVLEDINLAIPAGTCMALVGETGAGKSSLCSLVTRFYDPSSGRVLVDGIDVRRLDLNELRRNVGLVFQESFLFSHTVAANIGFGYPEATMEQIERAARIAAIHEFIVDLPQGYGTVLHEGGSDLSGGQRQRIAIARAILPDPAILILDDPTAAIDPQTEDEILQAMEGAMRGRTTILVTHRMSTLRRADLVAVLHEGRIIQSGTHQDLLQARGRYRWLARLQSADENSRRLLGETGGSSL